MGLYLAKVRHPNEHLIDCPEASHIRYLESLIELYKTVCTNFPKGKGTKTFRAENLHYIEIIEDYAYEIIEMLEEERGEIAVYYYKYKLSAIETAFKKSLQVMRGDNRLKIENSIRNHERVRGWLS
jgi:hypothetical protein